MLALPCNDHYPVSMSKAFHCFIPPALKMLAVMMCNAAFLAFPTCYSCVCVQGTGDDSDGPNDGQDDIENDFEEYEDVRGSPESLARLSKGWVAYLVVVLPPSEELST